MEHPPCARCLCLHRSSRMHTHECAHAHAHTAGSASLLQISKTEVEEVSQLAQDHAAPGCKSEGRASLPAKHSLHRPVPDGLRRPLPALPLPRPSREPIPGAREPRQEPAWLHGAPAGCRQKEGWTVWPTRLCSPGPHPAPARRPWTSQPGGDGCGERGDPPPELRRGLADEPV